MSLRTPIARLAPLLSAIALVGPVFGTVGALEAQPPPAGAERPLDRLQAEDRAAGDLFACALSLSDGTLLVGSLFDDDRGLDSGSAYVFDLGPAGWAQTAKLLGADTAAGDRFGFSVDLAGGRILIGAPLAGAGGAVYRFERGEGGWRQSFRWAAAEPGAAAGSAVALVADGREGWALVGAPLADAGGRTDGGAVLAFRLAGGGGQQPVRLEAPTPRAGAGFGWSVAGAGRWVAAGAPWAGTPLTGAGAVVLFESGPEDLRPLEEITAPDAGPFQAFGYSLDLAGDLLVVGAPRDGERGPGAGAVYLFRLREGGAVLEAKISGTAPGDQFGTAVAVAADGRSFAVGARAGDGAAGPDVGYVDLFFERSGNDWVRERRIQPPAASAGDEVGIDVDLSGGGIAVGAYKDDDGGLDAGAAYVLTPAADLALAKRLESPAVGVRSPAPGEQVVFVVEVENRGPDDAFGARVLDAPPAGLLGVAWTCAAETGARCTPSGQGSIDDRVDLPAGSRLTYRVTGTVAQGTAGALLNRASVDPPPGLFDPEPGNGDDQAGVPVGPPRADLYFDVRFLSGAVAVPGEAVVHELEIGNLGPSDAPALRFAGGGLGPAFVGPTWTCAAEAGATCVPGRGNGPIAGMITLPAGSRVVYRLEATANPVAQGNLVLAGGLGPLTGLDPDPSNNADRVATPLEPRTDLGVILSGPSATPPTLFAAPTAAAARARQRADTLPLRPGQTAVYEARVSSSGPSHARGLRLLASLPAGLAGAGWTCRDLDGTELSSAEDGVLDERFELAVDAVVVCSFAVRAVEGFLGSRSVTVTVSPERSFDDPDPSDNRAQAPGPLLLPDQRIAATLEAQGPFVEGGLMTYELLVGNGFVADLPDGTGDEVVLPVPPQLEAVSVSADSGAASLASPSTVTWNGEFPAEHVVTIRVQARIQEATRGSEVAAQATVTTEELKQVLGSAPPGEPEPAPTVFVVQGALDIPTASEWGLLLLALLLSGSALGLLRQRRTS